jgi:hypothetical protein
MSVHVYPVPGTDSDIEPIVEPFLESTVTQEGLSPNTQFLILLFGDSASDQIDAVRESVRNQNETARQALEIGQLRIDSIDERRLNTFTTSLLFNLLEVDSNADLRETLQSDVISDEDERKIDYYLPRVIETVSAITKQQQEAFEASLEETFPVELETEQASSMHERLEKDIVTRQTILDFLLLAASSTEDPDGVRSLVRHIRENDIDSTGYLSGGSENVSGYQRVFSISYDLTTGEFNDEFQTARSLYEDGATSELFRILNAIDTDFQLAEPYTHEAPIEQLMTSQFTGNNREIAERLLRIINCTRGVENNRDAVLEAFELAEEELQNVIDRTRGEVTQLDEFNDRFDGDRIHIDTSEVDKFDAVIEKAKETDSTVLRYLLGYEREQRTPVFTTLATRVSAYGDQLREYRNQIESHLEKIEELEARGEHHLETVETAYGQIEESAVKIELPSQQKVKREIETRWDHRIEALKSDLPSINLQADNEDIESTLDTWKDTIETAENELDEIAEPVERLETFNDQIEEISDTRERVRDTLSKFDNLMGTSQ